MVICTCEVEGFVHDQKKKYPVGSYPGPGVLQEEVRQFAERIADERRKWDEQQKLKEGFEHLRLDNKE